MNTLHLSQAKRPSGQAALVNSGKFGRRLVYVIPESYLEEGFREVQDSEFGIRLILKKEELSFL